MEETRKRRRFIYIPLALVALVGVVIFALYALNKPVERNPSLYLIPETYRGMATIRSAKEGAPPLPKEGNFIVHEIPPNGALETSSSPEYGFAQDEFYFVGAQGKRKKIKEKDWIQSRGMGGQEGGPTVGTFYVETKQDREKKQEK